MSRRIDSLYCSRDTASTQIKAIEKEIKLRAECVRREVADAVRQRIGALQQREQELLRSIDEMAMVKKQVLDAQLTEIMRGTCPPAAAETVDGEVDHDRFLVNADAVIAFRIGEEDFLDKINTFGAIGEDSAYASLSYAKGPALGVLKVDNPSYLWVYACDRNGHRRKDGGNLITPTVSNPECFQSMDVEDLKTADIKSSLCLARRAPSCWISPLTRKTATRRFTGRPSSLLCVSKPITKL